MTYNLLLHPNLEEDAGAERQYYDAKAPGLGQEFLQVFYASATDIPCNPMLYRKVYGEFRRRLMSKFPFALYFRVIGEDVIVFGLFHCARDPRTIKKALRARKHTPTGFMQPWP